MDSSHLQPATNQNIIKKANVKSFLGTKENISPKKVTENLQKNNVFNLILFEIVLIFNN